MRLIPSCDPDASRHSFNWRLMPLKYAYLPPMRLCQDRENRSIKKLGSNK
jgi:hypothetical protein